MKPFVSLFVLSLSAAIGSGYYTVNLPVVLCMKEDFSSCINVPYPMNCVDLNTVWLNSTDGGTAYPVANAVESVVVNDMDDETARCVVLFDAYSCQGRSLVMNAFTLRSANLYQYKFANQARSIRTCTPKLLKWLRDHPNEDNAGNAIPASARAADADWTKTNEIRPNGH